MANQRGNIDEILPRFTEPGLIFDYDKINGKVAWVCQVGQPSPMNNTTLVSQCLQGIAGNTKLHPKMKINADKYDRISKADWGLYIVGGEDQFWEIGFSREKIRTNDLHLNAKRNAQLAHGGWSLGKNAGIEQFLAPCPQPGQSVLSSQNLLAMNKKKAA